MQVETQLLALQERALGLERDAAALREADRHRSSELQQSSETASALRAQRDSVQERLAEVQEHLSRAVADTDRFRSQARCLSCALHCGVLCARSPARSCFCAWKDHGGCHAAAAAEGEETEGVIVSEAMAFVVAHLAPPVTALSAHGRARSAGVISGLAAEPHVGLCLIDGAAHEGREGCRHGACSRKCAWQGRRSG